MEREPETGHGRPIVYLFGRPRIVLDGETLRLPSPQTYLVLARLVFARGAALDRRDLALDLWPDAADPLGNLRRHIHYLNSAWRLHPGTTALFETSATRIRLSPAALRTDLFEFEAALGSDATLETAVGLAESELMQGFDDTAVERERNAIRVPLEAALRRLVERDRATDPAAALRWALRLRDLDPYREDGVLAVMRILLDAGDRTAALRAFTEFEALLARDLRAAPSPESAAFARALAAAPLRPHPAPIARGISTFVGRERDLGRLLQRLEGARLVTLTGPPGVGKTRLAKEAAHLLGERFGAIGFVDLAPVGADRVEAAILTAIRCAPQTPLAQAIAGFDGFVILDNCEHVVDAARAACQTMLEHHPTLHILVTSRRRLEAPDEALWRVEPLDPSASARLFFDRLSSARADADRSVIDVVAVSEIVRALDGIPLAIEIAAAQLRSTSLAELGASLMDRLGILRGAGSQTRSSLLRTFAWSEQLLREPERHAFHALGVFVEEFDLAAAAAAIGCEPVAAIDILDRLVSDSLVIPPALDAARASYALLQSVREFALDRLREDAVREAAVRRRTSDHFLRRVLELAGATGAFKPAPSAAIRPIAASVRAALDEAFAREIDAPLALQAAVALGGYFADEGLAREASAWYARGLALVRDDDPVRPHALRALAVATRIGGDALRSLELASEALALFRSTGDAAGAIRAAVTAGNACLVLDRLSEARGFATDGMNLMGDAVDPEAQILLLNFAGQLALSEGDVVLAENYYERSLLASAGGTSAASALAVVNLAVCAFVAHRYDRATALAEEALRTARSSGLRHHAAWALMLTASVAWRTDELETALGATAECLDVVRSAGLVILSIRLLEEMASYLVRRGRGRDASRYLGAAEAARRSHAIPLAPSELPDAKAREAAARDVAGTVTYETAFQVGVTLGLDMAVNEARGAIAARGSGSVAV